MSDQLISGAPDAGVLTGSEVIPLSDGSGDPVVTLPIWLKAYVGPKLFQRLNLYGGGFTGAFDASNEVDLIDAVIRGNNFNWVSFENDANLVRVWAQDNGDLASINLTGCESLYELDISNTNAMTDVDLSDCVALNRFNAENVPGITALDFSHNTALQNVDIYGSTGITALDLHLNPLIDTILATSCTSLASLNLTGLTVLSNIEMTGSAITALDTSTNVGLTYLNALSSASLTTVDLSNNSLLTYVSFSACALTEAVVNALLIALDGFGLSNGAVLINGGTNAAPSGAGATALDNLIGKGWTTA